MQWTSSPGCGLHAKLLEDAGIENYGHCQGRVTKRTRTVAGDKEAWLFAWDTLERQISASKGCYKVLKRAPAKGTLFQLLVHGEMVRDAVRCNAVSYLIFPVIPCYSL